MAKALMGVLNVESRREDAFTPQDVLIMKTLADLLATALHNAFVFQKLQQQSITDGLTGIKTRRFFWEALEFGVEACFALRAAILRGAG